MPTVTLPDPLYRQAEISAADSGISLAEFVAEAVQLHLNDDFTKEAEETYAPLTEEQLRIIRQGQEDIKAGRGLSREQVEAHFAAKRSEWLAQNRS